MVSVFSPGDKPPTEDQMSSLLNNIEYFALRNQSGESPGTLEVSQNLTEKRRLNGEQRLLAYAKKNNDG